MNLQQLIVLASILFATEISANSHHPEVFLQRIAGSKNEGKQLVEHYCALCHARKPMIELGAPRIGCPEDWQTRLKQGKSVLLQHTCDGLGLMPARGGCFECSDRQLLKALEALLSEVEPIKNNQK